MSSSAPVVQQKIVEIECLRAFAILFTLLAHYRFLYVETPSWIVWMDSKVAFHGGVDLFFVISGFVISKNLIPMAKSVDDLKGQVKFVSQFWVRRVYRLWPSAWLWAFVGLSVVAMTDRSTLVATIYDVAAALLQVYNYHAYSCMNGAGICSHQAVGVYWSLSLEEQFYVLLPLLLVTTKARAKWILAGLLFAAIPAHVFFPGLGGFFRWEAFCIGVLLAWLYANQTIRSVAQEYLFEPLQPVSWAIVSLMLIAIPLIGVGALGALSYHLTAVCAGILVAFGALDRGYLSIPQPFQRFMVWVGARSYSIYLVHSSVFLVFKTLAARGWRQALPPALQDFGWILLATGVVFLVSDLNFRFVESRFRQLGQRSPSPVQDELAQASN